MSFAYKNATFFKATLLQRFMSPLHILNKLKEKSSLHNYTMQNMSTQSESSSDKPKHRKPKDPEYFRKYYKNNRDHLRSYLAKKKECSCGAYISMGALSKHRKTAKHSMLLALRNAGVGRMYK